MFENCGKKRKLTGVVRDLNDNTDEQYETDMNTPFEQQLNQGAISSFSKSKKKRSMQRNMLQKTYRNQVEKAMKEIDTKLENERNSASIKLNIASSQFDTIDGDDSDITFNQLLSQVSSAEACDLSQTILTDSQTPPDFEIWETLDKGEKPEMLDSIPFNSYFDIIPSSPVNSPLSIILEQLIPEDDLTTQIKRSAFRYLKDEQNDITYICILLMTNKGVRRNKRMPLVLEIILPFGTITPAEPDTPSIHLHHVCPRDGKFSEDLIQVKINGEIDPNTRNNLIKTFKRNFPPQIWTEYKECNIDTKAEPYDTGVLANTLAIVQIAKVKNPVIVKIVSFNQEEVLIAILKPEQRSTLKWNVEPVQTKWFPRSSLLATSIPAFSSEQFYHLKEKPSTTLSKLGIRKKS